MKIIFCVIYPRAFRRNVDTCLTHVLLRVFPGGHREFHRRHRELCEDTLLPNGTAAADSSTTLTTTVSGCASRGPGCPVLSISGPPTPQPTDIDSHPASRVLPFLYLGNGRDAADLQLLRALGATRVLNVTSQLPGYHQERGITYRQIPASDSGHQNLKQYFEEAFDFIGEYRGRRFICSPGFEERTQE